MTTAAAFPVAVAWLGTWLQRNPPVPVHLPDSMQAGPFGKNVYATTADSPAFWLYLLQRRRMPGQPLATAGLPAVQIRVRRRSRMRQPSGVRISRSS